MARVKEILKGAGGSVAEKLLIPPSLIDVEPGFNVRLPGIDLDEHIDTLAGLIKLNGFDPTQPISVSRLADRFVVRSGHCRFAAVQRLIQSGTMILTVPALLEPAGTNDVNRNYQIGTQNGQKPITDLEYGILVKRQRGYGQTDAQIVEGFGKNRAWLSRVLDLAAASPDIHLAVANRQISATAAVDAVRRNGAGAGTIIAEAIKTGGGHAKPRHVREVQERAEPPRTEPVSLCSLAVATVRAWRALVKTSAIEDRKKFEDAIDALEGRLGPLMKKEAVMA